MSFPTRKENPTGLHGRYHIQKVVGEVVEFDEALMETKGFPMLKPVDKDSEYFVLRLDDGGKDPNHIAACRKAVLVYADEIEPYIPQLAADLRERYQ
jgi:hypothetical protein